MAMVYRMAKHPASKGGKPPVIGIKLVRSGLDVRKWYFGHHKTGDKVPFTFGGYDFTLHFSRKRYANRRHRSGYTVVAVVNITAKKYGESVSVPKWFRYISKGE